MATRQNSTNGKPKSPRIQVVIPELICEQLIILAESESRTVSNMAKVLIQEGIKNYFEKEAKSLATDANINTDHYRDTLEKLIFDYAFNNSIPTIGICRGMQMINVASGGSLYADIPTQIGNAVTHRNNGEVNHSIYLVDPLNTYNSSIFPKNDTSSSFIVNSWHHQGLNDLAKGVIVLARSNDMLPEAIVLDSNLHPFMIAVQFHPELKSKPFEPHPIFSIFVKKALEQTRLV